MPWMRIVITGTLLGAFYWLDIALTLATPYIINQTAIGQMDGTASGYLQTQLGQQGLMLAYRAGFLALCALLLAVWWKYITKAWAEIVKAFTAPLILLSAALVSSGDAKAFKAASDYTEIFRLAPNHTGILVPLRGDVKAQAAFGSEDFLRSNVVGARMVTIPHGKIEGTGVLFNKIYNTHVLYIIVHTPYSNVWTHSKETGTSAKDESLRCESSDSISIRADIAVAARISDPVKYLFHFGTDPKQWLAAGDTQAVLEDEKDPNNASILFARSIQQVMDTIARPMLQAEWCNRIMALPLAKLAEAKGGEAPIKVKALTDAVVAVKASLGDRGIDLIFAGYANELTYPESVQAAIDRKFVAETNAVIAPVLKELAYIEALHAFSVGLKNGTIKMPENLVVVPENWADKLKEAVTTGGNK